MAPPQLSTRQRIVTVAAELLQESPDVPVSTRKICEAAGVTAPTLYHHFGDKEGLYDAVAAYGFEAYLEAKRTLVHSDDPVSDLRNAWDAHVEFGVGKPALYSLMYGNTRARLASPAAQEARTVLADLLTAVARAGRLAIAEELATPVVEAACVGATLQAIKDGYDPSISHHLRDTVIDSVTTGGVGSVTETGLRATANQLSACLDSAGLGVAPLRPTEMALLREWLTALAGQP